MACLKSGSEKLRAFTMQISFISNEADVIE